MTLPDAEQSQAELAYQYIEQMIVERTLRPGSMISEKRLCADLACGRTPVREALQRLKLEGYIDILPSRGALVAPVDVMAQLELLEMRRPLELLLVRLAAVRATAEQRAEIDAWSDALGMAAEREDRQAFFLANRTLQQLQCAAAHNAMLAKTMAVVYGQSRRFWFTTFDAAEVMKQAAMQYRTTATALVAGDGTAASASVAAFLDFLEGLTRATIDRRRPT